MAIKTKIILSDVKECTSLGIRDYLSSQPKLEMVTSSAGERLQEEQETDPFVIVTDITHPLQAGMKAIESLVAMRHPVPVIVFTSSEKACIIKRLLKAGIKGYVSTNSAMEELLYAIETARSGNRYLCPVIKSILKKNGISLSQHQRNIIHLMKEGKTDAEIGTALYKSPRSIESQRIIIKSAS